ncbi:MULTISPECIES: MFS transporter [Rhizobium]|uniref:MFS family permease n=1 Tax=Rhizobium tropici TaxID=398 RepID=A0A6P1C2N9_RHITR|nr:MULTISPECIES: MFS transporter [Rhizobium]AGB73158.1 putative major facilitator superfamily (MFS) drug efflux transporter [Rhizobium tropici CIAT 899]MBB4243666.1 MFS family permease [Rhizobium tropici]MBB5595885.1 MFS family permease [Rhizobium tropici]MBB6493877.1 MFS family permease [Rhizobium tropici]NEV11318.1 MFS transporter [Rhizobium tropici]
MKHVSDANATPDPRRWMALVILLTGAFLPPLDFFIVNVALPSIREDFRASASTMQLIISGYAATYAVMLITGGRLGDLYGRRNVFMAGMVGFAVASALCGFAWSPLALIVGRVLQGFAAAIMAPQALASINAIFPDHEKSKALSFYALTFGLASMAGLFLGGALIALNILGLGWRAIFLINLPIIAIAAPSAFIMLQETRSEQPSKLDLGGALLIALALLALVAPLIEGREQGWPIWSIVTLAASLPIFLLFWRHEKYMELAGRDPILAPSLLQNRGLMHGLLAALFFYALAAFWLIFSVYQQGGLGRTPFKAGLAILPAAVGFVLGPFASERVLRVFGRFSAGIGMVLQAVGLFGTAALISNGLPQLLFVALFLIGAGQGIALPNLVKSIVQRVDRSQSGLASGLVNSMLQIGGAFAAAIIGGLFFSILGSATDIQSIGRAYSVAATTIAICLLVAGWLSVSLASTKPSRP